jgi:hypothetical protein
LLRREDKRTKRALDALLPADPGALDPAQLLGDALARFLAAVSEQPLTWRVALLRPESAPLALQKLVNRRRAEIARRLEPLVRWGLATLPGVPATLDVEVLSRMLLSVGEEQGRLALEDPEFPPDRLLASTWTLLDALPVAPEWASDPRSRGLERRGRVDRAELSSEQLERPGENPLHPHPPTESEE